MVSQDFSLLIKGASIKEDNVELKKARELNLEILEYNEAVGNLTNMFKTICVCGTLCYICCIHGTSYF